MVSEGVDIPRLAVGVYASRVRTDLFFRQVTGRFVRMRTPEDETTATLLVPSIEPLLRYATAIETTVTNALDDDQDQIQREMKERDRTLQLDFVEPLASSEAVHHSTILTGESFSDAELQHAESLIRDGGLPASTTAAQLARVLRMAGGGRVVGTATITVPAAQTSLADEKVVMRRLIKRKVAQLNRITDEPYAHIHHQLNDLTGDKVPTATSESLQARLNILDEWIANS
jgi:superfamily II DNA or RNA helicase